MALNLNIYAIVIQPLDEANMTATSPGELDETPPPADGCQISAQGKVRLCSLPTSEF